MKVLIRGAGDMASGIAYRLAKSGLHVLMTETDRPMAVRRAVSFCEAVYDGAKEVEGMTARLVSGPDEFEALWKAGELPVLIDPEMTCLTEVRPPVIIDAIIAKKNTGLSRDMAPLTIGLGPGFSAPDQVHLVIETNRGHNLGRLIYDGVPADNTHSPGNIGGYTIERVLRSPAEGVFDPLRRLGDKVEKDELIARVAGQDIRAQVGGVIRGLLREGAPVKPYTTCGDVDPRGELEYLYTITDKARALGGSALEGILAAFNR